MVQFDRLGRQFVGLGKLLVSMLAATSALLGDSSVKIDKRLFDYSHSIRVKAVSEYNERVGSPVSWLPVSFLVDDGSQVAEGEVIAKFDTSIAEYDLQNLQLERDYVEADLRRRLTDIDNVELDLTANLAELKDLLAVAQAELTTLLELPDEDEVRLQKGRVRVARLNFEAAEKDRAKAESRYERGLISRAQLEDFTRKYSERRALLEFAVENYEFAQLPATPATIRRKELEIENLQSEIHKFEHRLSEQSQIASIRKESARTKKRAIDQKITIKQSDIDSAVVTSPIDGYIRHRLTFATPLRIGDKMWRGYNFMSIPDLSQMVLKGVLPEALRTYFNEGDRVTVVLAGQEDTVIAGHIKSISQLPRDLAEVEESSFGEEIKEFGVKVYDVTIAIAAPETDLKPGRQGRATLWMATAEERPAVPLRYVKIQKGKYYVSLEGIFREVSGVAYRGYFFLDDANLLGKIVYLNGEFPITTNRLNEQQTARFRVSGEMLPTRTASVRVGTIGGSYEIKWLIAEETEVKKGALVAQIDTTEIEKQIEQSENAFNEAQADIEEQKKELELKKREELFKLEKAERLLEMAKLRMNTVVRGRDYPAIFQAELDLKQAEIRLEDLNQRLAAQDRKERLTISPFEYAELKRDVQRVQLQVEKHTIRLNELNAGADPVEVSQARLDYLMQKVEVDQMKYNMDFESKRAQFELEEAELDLRRKKMMLDKRIAQKERTNLYAPVDGIIQYSKIWNSGGVSKVSVGSVVGSRFPIMSLPDMSAMYLSVEVPERYFQQVKEGMLVDVVIPSLNARALRGRVSGIDLLFENKQRKDGQVGLYSAQEPLGQVVFKVRVDVLDKNVSMKPGVIGEVEFDFATNEGDV